MRCQDVTREISSPTGAVTLAELNRHLEGCPRCAAWARQSEQLDRVWADTQPAEPVGACDTTWASVSRRLDQPAERPVASSHRRRWAVALAVPIAAAAAVFVAMATLLHHGDSHRPQMAQQTQPHTQAQASQPERPALVAHHVDVDAGLPVLIHMENQEVDVELLKRMTNDNRNMVAADFDMFNTLESLAQQ